METPNQAKNLIQRSQSILIVPAPEAQGDSFGSALALFFTLKELGKNANISFADKIPEKFSFLIDSAQKPIQDFVISVDTSGKDISKMYYEKNEKDLKIYLTLSTGALEGKDLSLAPRIKTEASPETPQSSFDKNPDLIIVLGAESLDGIGENFTKNPGLFYETTILNIDNHPLNENFGEINLIEASSSLAEITTELIKSLDPTEELLSGRVATCLLTGIVYASQNFRSPRTKPKTFETSAFLINKGADHQKIVQCLYKQKNVSQVRLLGRILEKLSFDEKRDLYSAGLVERDFTDCQATSKDLSFAVEELKLNFRHLPNLLILWESHASPPIVKGVFCSSRPDLIEKVLKNFEGAAKGGGALFLIREGSLGAAKEKIFKIL